MLDDFVKMASWSPYNQHEKYRPNSRTQKTARQAFWENVLLITKTKTSKASHFPLADSASAADAKAA
jgi:hypothetical protein